MQCSWDWLQERDGLLGCAACHAAGINGAMAAFRVSAHNVSNIQRHAKTASHKRAVENMAKNDVNIATNDIVDTAFTVPSDAEFCGVWNKMKGGQTMIQKTTSGVDTCKKSRAMLWCLAEAIRRQHREMLRTAAAVTIMQDERKGYMLIRFRASDELLKVSTGNIGLFEGGGTGEEVACVTMQALQLFCTPNLGRPSIGTETTENQRRRRPEPVCDEHLLEHIASNIFIFHADAAGDELVASEALMETPEEGSALLPSLTLAGRDKTHAATRVLERPYKADECLEETFNRMVFNHDSIAAIIQNAPHTFGKLLTRNIEK